MQIDERSAKNIATLLPPVQELAKQWMAKCQVSGLSVKIIDGSRTYEQQDALYHQRPKVTNARGGQSLHNFGIAFDFGIFNGPAYIPESPLYKKAGEIAESLGLEWGGRWKSIVDEPHIQYKTGLTLAQMRERHEKGLPVIV